MKIAKQSSLILVYDKYDMLPFYIICNILEVQSAMIQCKGNRRLCFAAVFIEVTSVDALPAEVLLCKASCQTIKFGTPFRP